MKKSYIKKPKKITDSYLRNSGLYYLERFPASTYQFRKIMTNKIKRSCSYHKEQDFNSCLERLDHLIEKYTNLGLLNDHKYTEMLLHSLTNKGKSKKYIYFKLKEKGINESIINEALNKLADDFDFKSLLLTARKSKFPPFSSSKNKNYTNKLLRAGFSYNDIESLNSLTIEDATTLIESLD